MIFLKKIVWWVAFGLLVFASTGCRGQVQNPAFQTMLDGLLSHNVPEINVQQAAADSARTVFLDARAQREFEVSHIRGAVFVGYDDFDLERVAGLPKNSRFVVYCSVGYRSEKVCEKLRAAGFTDVSNLVGGIFEWSNAGLPVFDAAGPTKNVHAFDKTWGVWLKKGRKVYDK